LLTPANRSVVRKKLTNIKGAVLIMQMNSSALDNREIANTPRWFAIYTNGKQEVRAFHNLLAWGLESFNPMIKEYRRNQFTGLASFVSRPLFPRYIFARFAPLNLMHKVTFTRGVQRIVSFNDEPCPIDDEVIAFLKSRVGSDGFVSLGTPLKAGDKVRIKDGPWKALEGVVERDVKPSERVMLLLTAINFQGRLTIESDWLEKIA
jgi:transcriptional antiterminator RfaH